MGVTAGIPSEGPEGTSEINEVIDSPEGPELTQEPEQQEPESSGHPAWQPILEAVPSSLHGVIRPELENWDKGVQSRFEELNSKYSPYNDFVEQGISPQDLEVAYNISQQIDQDPVTFFTRMQEYLVQNGLLEGQEEQGQEEQPLEYDFGEQEVPEYVQQLQQQIQTQQQQIQQFYEGMNNYAQQQQEQEITQQAESQLDQELQELEQEVGSLDPLMKRELFTRMIAMQQQAEKAVPLKEAYQSIIGFVSHYNKQQPNPGKNAPRVLPTGGGLPAPQAPKPAIDESERKSRAAEVIRRMQEN